MGERCDDQVVGGEPVVGGQPACDLADDPWHVSPEALETAPRQNGEVLHVEHVRLELGHLGVEGVDRRNASEPESSRATHVLGHPGGLKRCTVDHQLVSRVPE